MHTGHDPSLRLLHQVQRYKPCSASAIGAPHAKKLLQPRSRAGISSGSGGRTLNAAETERLNAHAALVTRRGAGMTATPSTRRCERPNPTPPDGPATARALTACSEGLGRVR